MPTIPAVEEAAASIREYITPNVLLPLLHYTTLATVVAGLLLSLDAAGTSCPALTVAGRASIWISIDQSIELIMAFDVQFMVWPNEPGSSAWWKQPRSGEDRNRRARASMPAARPTMFSIGLLCCIVAQQNIPV